MIPHQRSQDRNCRTPFAVTLTRILIAGLYLSACTYPSVTPTPGVVPTAVNLLPPTSLAATASPSTPTNTPVFATLTAQPLMTLVSPTPTCGAPAGWVRYTIRPGDTLFRLGVKTNITVDEIKLANCLTEDLIFTGDPLFLPFTPPTDVPIPPTSIPGPVCRGPFSCPSGSLPSFPLPAGGPNGAVFISCEFPRPDPWIEPFPPSSKPELGTRLFLFVCDFPADQPPATAKVTIRKGSEIISETPVDLMPPKLNPDLPLGRAQAVVDWPVLPTQPISQTLDDKYTLTVSSANGQKTASFDFHVVQPTTEHILAVPAMGSLGKAFDIYYVNFPLNTTQIIEFYGEDQPVQGQEHALSKRAEWQILITNPLAGTSEKGWTKQISPLQSFPNDLTGAYVIRHGPSTAYEVIWLIP